MRCSAVYPWTLNVATRGVLTHLETLKIIFGRGSAPDPAGGAHDAPPDPLVGWGPPIPHSLDALGFSILGAYGASQLNRLIIG